MRRVIQALEQRAVKVAKSELDELIATASSAIQIYVEDNDDVDELKKAFDLFRDITGILKLMQVHGAVLLAKETTDVIHGLVEEKIEQPEQAQDVLSRAVMHLSDYLEHVEAGNKDIPLALMPLLNDLRSSRGAALLSENVLFFPNLDNISLPAKSSQIEETDKAWLNLIRSKFQKALLQCINGDDIPTAAAQLCKLCIRLQRGSDKENAIRLWWVASAFAQCVAVNGVPYGNTIVSIFGSIDRKIKLLIEVGEAEFAKDSHESLVKNILYYIAIAENRGRIVNQVKDAYQLNGQIPEIKELDQLRQEIGGPSSEVLIAVSKALLDDLASAKDCIELYMHSNFEDADYMNRLHTIVLKISDTLSMIGIEEYREKVDAQITEVEFIKEGNSGDVDLSLLGISETILEIETCINNFIEYRISFGANQKNDQAENQNNETILSSEHQAALNVALSEALLRIEQTKELLTEVVHNAYDQEKISFAVQSLQTIIGLSHVIEIEEPVKLIHGICTYISSANFEKDIVQQSDALHDLADCLISLQCYFEQLELRAPNGQQIIDYGDVALNKIVDLDDQKVDDAAVPVQIEDVQIEDEQVEDLLDVDLSIDESIQSSADIQLDESIGNSSDVGASPDKHLLGLPDLNEMIEDHGLLEDEHIELDAVSDDILEVDDLLELNDPVQAKQVVPTTQTQEPVKAGPEKTETFKILTEDADPELLEIFIEEANQVAQDIQNNWNAWLHEQKNWDSFVEMRRGFHTLKGSGRFAGAELLGEFAWGLENLCNKLINKKMAITSQNHELIDQSLKYIPQLIAQLSDQQKTVDIDIAGLMEQAKLAAEGANDIDVSNSKASVVEQNLVSAELEVSVASDNSNAEISADEKLKEELTGIFSSEAMKYLVVLKEAQDQHVKNAEPINLDEDVLRAMHNLRGSARTAGADAIFNLCDPVEEVIAYSIKQEIKFNDEQSKLVSRGFKEIVSALEHLTIHGESGAIDQNLIADFERLKNDLHNNKEVDTAKSADEVRSSAVDINKEIMIDRYADLDQELCEIFFEEAEDVLATCQACLQKLQLNVKDGEALSELRRQLHTLKGSSRMAGLNTVGELSHVAETLLVSLVEKKSDLSSETLMLIQKVVDASHQSVEAAQAKNDISLDEKLVAEILDACGEQKSTAEESAEVIPEPAQPNFVIDESAIAQPAEPKVEINERAANEDVLNQKNVIAEESIKVEVAQKVESVKEQQANSGVSQNNNTQDLSDNEVSAEQAVSKTPSTDAEKREFIRVQSDTLDNLVNDAGEVNILHSRLEQNMQAFNFSIKEYDQTVSRLHEQLRKLEMETEAQILFKHADDQNESEDFDPLELDRYSDIQQLSRALAESAADLVNIKEMFVGHSQNWEDILVQQRVAATNLQDGLLHTRMVKFSSINSRLQRIVRQTSDELKKNVELNIEGAENDIDRSVLNRIIAPLEHLIRNGIGHGIEQPEVRQQQGKLAVGKINIQIARESAEIIITVSDDGAGINPERVLTKAIENGMVDPDSQLTKDEVLKLIFQPGFSTADQVSRIAGRGVGMDVVDKEIRILGGSIKVNSQLIKGTEFILRLPFTLAVSQALMVRAGREVYALTLVGIEGVITLPVKDLKQMMENQSSFTYAGRDYDFYHLGSLLQSGGQEFEDETLLYPVLLVCVGEQRLALQVEASLGSKEIVVKPLASQVVRMQGISGATILGDGQVALIIDTPWIAQLAQSLDASDQSREYIEPANRVEESTVMVVDDSITIRKVTTRFLERNNYKVATAKDGVDALQKLQKMVPQVLLLDIEMPRMDGYELAAQIRKDERLKQIPIIMITSRSGDKHRNRAMELGVERYLGKPYNEADLLSHIEALDIKHP